MKAPNIFSLNAAFLAALIIGLAAGPARASTLLTPSLSVSEQYTDNADNTASGQREEFITVVSPGFSVVKAEKSYDLKLNYRPGFTFYHRNSDNDATRQNADAALNARLSRQTEFTLTDSFSRTEQPRTAADLEAQTGQAIPVDPTIRRGRQPYSTNTVTAALTHRFGRDDSLGLGYTHHLLENDDPLLTDSQRHNPWARISYWFTPQFGIDTDLSYERGEFEAPEDDLDQYKATVRLKQKLSKMFTWFLRYSHTVADYDGATADYTIYDPGLGLSWTLDPDTTLNVDAGYFVQHRDGSDDEAGLSFTGDIGRTWRVKRGSLRLSGQSGYEETGGGAENLGLDIYYGIDGSAAYALTKEISASANASYRRNKYVNLASKRKDHTYDLGVGLNYRPVAVRWLSFSLRYTYHDIDSSLDANDTTENSVLFSISLTPVTPYRLD